MKAVGFFFAVFSSMLAVFLVATGEVKRWISPGDDPHLRLVVRNASRVEESGKNLFSFDHWDVKEGRRSFTIRGELSQENLSEDARLDELQEVSLKDGIIEIPIHKGKELAPAAEAKGDRRLKEVLLEFQSALYRRQAPAGREKARLEIVLRNGKGTTNEGTVFHFEELFFADDPSGGGRFLLHSEKPVSIINPYLEVQSPSGLTGSLKERGFDSISFLPPVTTYLESGAASLISLGREDLGRTEGSEGDRAERAETPAEKVAITCQGPLEIRFRGGGGRDGLEEARAPRPVTTISFEKDVLIHSVSERRAGQAPPPPQGNSFLCQRLELEVDDAGDTPLPRKATATWPDGRVEARIVRKDGISTLDGDRLEWTNAAASGDPEGKSQVVLTGWPRLSSETARLVAERAVLALEEDLVRLENVQGSLLSDAGSRSAGGRAAGGAPRRAESLFARTEPADAAGRTGGGSGGAASGPAGREGASGKEAGARELEIAAEEADVFLTSAGGRKVISRLVARSREANGVVVRGKRPQGPKGLETGGETAPGNGAGSDLLEPPLLATGNLLTYSESERQVTLEGTRERLPRITQGRSWMEAERVHLLLEENVFWFERQVSAHLEGGPPAARGEGQRAPERSAAENEERSFDIAADFLALRLEKSGEMRQVLARGSPSEPVRLTVNTPSSPAAGGEPGAAEPPLPGGWTRYTLLAPEVRWDHAQQAGELSGGPGGGQPARLEMEGGAVFAGSIHFEQRLWKAYLRDQVEVLLPSRGSKDEELRMLAAKADVEFHERFEGLSAPGAAPGPLGRLQAIKSLQASGGPGRLEVRGADFRLKGEEAVWSAAAGRLRLFGESLQEIELLDEDLQGPVRAREIIYDQKRRLVILRDSVSGILRQRPRQASPAASKPRAKDQPLVWEFETSSLEIELLENEGGGSLEIAGFRARDKVLLRNRENGLQLRGDDMVYEHATGKLRVFSQDGRPQTLVRYKEGWPDEQAVGPPAPDLQDGGNADKILSQEIVVLLDQRGGERREEGRQMVLVRFQKDVIATFSLSRKSLGKLGSEAAEAWKMVAEDLTLLVDPAGESGTPRMIPWAVASAQDSEVVFSSGPYQATAKRVIFEEAHRRVKLIGSPARIVNAPRKPSPRPAPVILFSKPGEEVIIEYPPESPADAAALPALPR
jgi:hypothetical protein